MTQHYDAIVIGAGVSGLYALYKLRELGLSARVFEAGTDIGGTWYWNRYPGARFDSESYSYQYSFSQELIDEWEWSEHFSGQPEIERYLHFVADKFDLKRDIECNARVATVMYDEADKRWEIDDPQRFARPCALCDLRHRAAFGAPVSGLCRGCRLCRPVAAQRALAERTGRLHGQASRHHRHRPDCRPDHSDHCPRL